VSERTIAAGARDARPRTTTRAQHLTTLVWVLAAALLIYLIVVPFGYMTYESFTDKEGQATLANIPKYFGMPFVVEATVNTFLLSGAVTLLSVLLGVPLAFGVSRTDMWGKGLVRSTVLVSIITPPFLRAVAYVILAGPNVGYLNQLLRFLLGLTAESGPLDIFSAWGFVVLSIPGGVAFVFLQTAAAFENMDPSLEEGARLAGATPRQVAFRITLPMAKHAVLSGALLAFSVSLAMYGIPHILNVNVLTIAIRKSLLMPLDFKAASTLSMIVLVASLITLFLYRLSVRAAKKFQTITGRGFRPSVMRLGRWRHGFTALGLFYGLFAFALPYGMLVLVSFMRRIGYGLEADNFTLRNYLYMWAEPLPRTAIINSFILATASSTVVVLLGIVIGYLIGRTQARGRAVLDYLSVLPLGIAGTALAAGLIIVYLNQPFSILGVYATLWILLIAYVTRFIPFGVRYCQTAFMQVSQDLEEAARLGGANWFQTVWHILLPLVKRGALYAWIVAFLSAFPEISASVLLRNIGTDVVATAILDMWDGTGGLPAASALSVLVFLVLTLLVLVAQRVTGRSMLESS
jgi:iron(III) transport system permease protein